MDEYDDELPIEDILNRCTDATEVSESRVRYDGNYSEFDGYKRLRVWQVSMELVQEIYRLAALFPASEQFGLVSQTRRAVISVPLNIAEGWGRNSKAELARFCDIARGSLHEVDAALEIAIALKYIERSEAAEARSLFKRIGTMSLNLAKILRQPVDGRKSRF